MSLNSVTFRSAQHKDLLAIVQLLTFDPLGNQREHFENPLPPGYEQAFADIAKDPNNDLIVAELAGNIVGVLQLTLIPNLTYQGSRRALIEGVRVSTDVRGQGIGRALMEKAFERAARDGCRLAQLTTDKQRPEALRFYESLGFRPTHEGMKRPIVRVEKS